MKSGKYVAAVVCAAICAGLGAVAVPAVAGAAAKSAAGTLTFAMIAPFSGPTAYYGGALEAGCYPAAAEINQGGGILGHKVTCKVVDDKGDPADAVPDAYQMLSSTPNLVGVLGPCGDTSTAVNPILEHAKMPSISCSGQDVFDHSADPYFWRNLPSDGSMGLAMAAYAKQRGYSRVALVFQNDTSAQGSVPGVVQGAKALGLKVALNLTLSGDNPSYSTEVARVVQANPQAILTETDPQTAGTFWRDMIQAGHFYPVIGTLNVMVPPYIHAVAPVVGKARLTKDFTGLNPFTPTTQKGFATWTKYADATKSQLAATLFTLHLQYNESPYDGMIVMALAMDEAHSTKGSVYVKDMMKIFNGTKGAVDVSSYAQGAHLIAQGKAIRWDGAEGLQSENRYHNTAGNFEIQKPTASLGIKNSGTVNAKYLTKAATGR